MRKIIANFFISPDGVEPTIPLELLRSEAFSTGVLNLGHGPAGS